VAVAVHLQAERAVGRHSNHFEANDSYLLAKATLRKFSFSSAPRPYVELHIRPRSGQSRNLRGGPHVGLNGHREGSAWATAPLRIAAVPRFLPKTQVRDIRTAVRDYPFCF
jgi:hypothetical protein